jgi:hypothetical protein
VLMAPPIARLALSMGSCGPLVAAWSQPDRGQVVGCD